MRKDMTKMKRIFSALRLIVSISFAVHMVCVLQVTKMQMEGRKGGKRDKQYELIWQMES